MRKKKEEVIVIKEEPIKDEYYILKVGETLEDVAKKFNLDVNRLRELNGEVTGGNQIRVK